MKKQWLYVAMLTVTIAACNSNNGDNNTPPPPPPAPPSATTLASFMATLFQNTSDTAIPVEINTVNLDTSSEDDAQFNALII